MCPVCVLLCVGCVSVWSWSALQFALQDLKIALANTPSVHPPFVLYCIVYYKSVWDVTRGVWALVGGRGGGEGAPPPHPPQGREGGMTPAVHCCLQPLAPNVGLSPLTLTLSSNPLPPQAAVPNRPLTPSSPPSPCLAYPHTPTHLPFPREAVPTEPMEGKGEGARPGARLDQAKMKGPSPRGRGFRREASRTFLRVCRPYSNLSRQSEHFTCPHGGWKRMVPLAADPQETFQRLLARKTTSLMYPGRPAQALPANLLGGQMYGAATRKSTAKSRKASKPKGAPMVQLQQPEVPLASDSYQKEPDPTEPDTAPAGSY